MISDKRIDQCLAPGAKILCSPIWLTAPEIVAALTELRALRQRDAAIEKAMREVEDDSEVVECIKVEFVNEKFHAAIEEWDYGCVKRVEAPTFAEALSALAAGLEGGSHE